MQEKETTLLDSSLNTNAKLSNVIFKYQFHYNLKVIDLQEYKQVYIYPLHRQKLLKGNEKEKLYDLNLVLEENYQENYNSNTLEPKKVDFKNVIRSKLKLQRLAKANEKEWKTFITLTFSDNITELSEAYKKLYNCLSHIKARYKHDLKWICVPEYQKSGRVHYHLLSNIELNDPHLVSIQVKDDKIYYHLKSWQKIGFNLIEEIKDKDGNDSKKICGYIAKYMTKQYIEDSFFNRNRYYCSQNLIQPKEYYIDEDYEKDQKLLQELLNDYEVIYENYYLDSFNNKLQFIELKKLDI